MDLAPDQISTRRPPPFIWLKKSLRKKGVRGLADFFVSYASDFWFDAYYGTSTSGWLPSSQFGTTSSADGQQSGLYQATKSRPFKKLLGRLAFPAGSVFVDLGCGKGKALLIASRFGFAKAVGVEFARELCEAARTNIEKYQRKVGRAIEIQIIESDILDYAISPSDNVFYLYNSFGEAVLRKFLENVRASIAAAPRKVWLIYHIPLHREVVEELGLFPRRTDHFVGGTEFVVYESE